jgi:hypothetical protein
MDGYGRQRQQSTCLQNIYFDRKHVSDVLLPADVTISCSGNVNTDPSATGAPYLTAFGQNWPLYPNGGNCEMQSAYVDQLLPVCEGTYKILRTWTVYDWCLPTSTDPSAPNPKYFIQVIKVIDDAGPAMACPANVTVSNRSVQLLLDNQPGRHYRGRRLLADQLGNGPRRGARFLHQ